MRRLTQEGPRSASLRDELNEMETIFLGASAAAWRDLGGDPLVSAAEALPRFARWRATAADDADIGRDARMMVPVFYDLGRRKTKVWAFLGWKATTVDVTFHTEPHVMAVEPMAARHPAKRSPQQPP